MGCCFGFRGEDRQGYVDVEQRNTESGRSVADIIFYPKGSRSIFMRFNVV